MSVTRRAAIAGVVSVLAAPRLARADADAGAAREPHVEVDAAALAGLLTEVAKARRAVKTLTASFTQERVIALLATRVRSTGKLVMVGPDRLRWELAPPDRIIYWITPDGIAYRTPRSSAALPPSGQSAKVAQALADVRAMIGGDLHTLEKRYTLSASRGATEVTFKGAAREPATRVRSFEVTTAKDLVRPVRARIVEGKRDATEIVFEGVKINETVDPALVRPS